MKTLSHLSATDLAIAIAKREGTLRVEIATNRFGDDFLAISDDNGLIEVAMSKAEAEARIASL